jgi:PAS domain-containing protein
MGQRLAAGPTFDVPDGLRGLSLIPPKELKTRLHCGVAQWKRVGFIRRRSEVRFLPTANNGKHEASDSLLGLVVSGPEVAEQSCGETRQQHFTLSHAGRHSLAARLFEGGMSKILDAIINDLQSREQRGVAKYGTTVDRTDLTRLQWLQHAYEECLDQAVYLRRLIAESSPKALELRAEEAERALEAERSLQTAADSMGAEIVAADRNRFEQATALLRRFSEFKDGLPIVVHPIYDEVKTFLKENP